MDDLEICKRIAEIEGVDYIYFGKGLCVSDAYGFLQGYNPLTDDALCFQFCYRGGIEVKKSLSVIDGKMEWNGKYYAKHPKNTGFGSVDKSPNKAVCLEKIELHKEANNETIN